MRGNGYRCQTIFLCAGKGLNAKFIIFNALTWRNWKDGRRLTGFDPKIGSPDLYGVGFYANRLIHNEFTVCHIVLPAVPGASDGDSMELTLAQGSSAV